MYFSCTQPAICCMVSMISVQLYPPALPGNHLLIYWVLCPKFFYTVFYTSFINVSLLQKKHMHKSTKIILLLLSTQHSTEKNVN